MATRSESAVRPRSMGNLRAVLFASAASLAAACGGGGNDKPDALVLHLDAAIDAQIDAPPLPDAPEYDFSCMGNAAPTTAAAMITVTGTAQGLSGMSAAPLDMVSLEAHAVSNDAVLAMAGPTTSAGTFSVGPITTNNMPVDAYIRATRAGSTMERTTLVYPPSPLTENLMDAPVLMISDTNLNMLTMGLITQMPNKGFLAVFVVDCKDMPVAGASLSAKVNGTTDTGNAIDLGTFAPQAAGTWFVFDADVGDITLSATLGSHTFRSHVVKSAAQTTTTTILRPGF